MIVDDDYDADDDDVSNMKRLTNQEMQHQYEEIVESIADAADDVNAATVIADLNAATPNPPQDNSRKSLNEIDISNRIDIENYRTIERIGIERIESIQETSSAIAPTAATISDGLMKYDVMLKEFFLTYVQMQGLDKIADTFLRRERPKRRWLRGWPRQ